MFSRALFLFLVGWGLLAWLREGKGREGKGRKGKGREGKEEGRTDERIYLNRMEMVRLC